MSIDLLIMVCFAVLILLIAIWVYIGFQGIQNKLANHVKSIDNLMRIHYKLNKDLNELKKQFNNALLNKGLDDKKVDIKINEALATRVMPMLETLKKLKNSVDEFTNEHEERMMSLEERTKSISKITPPSFEMQEDKIANYFKNGKSIEDIARELRISENKVIMVLKIRHLIK